MVEWLEHNGDAPFFVHASFIRPHPPQRNPVGYHDLYAAEAVGPFVGCATPEEEAALHPFGALAVGTPGVGAPRDERERRQLRATYYGAQREVDDGLAPLFDYLVRSGLAETTLVVVTSDHGEMGGDHWLLEKLGYWDESYHVPLIVVDPRPEADGARGRVVEAVTESVDVLPTICEFLGAEVPLQADGWSLGPSCAASRPPPLAGHGPLRVAFSDPVHRRPRGLRDPDEPLCAGGGAWPRHKYVQFAADADVLPPLLFDLGATPSRCMTSWWRRTGGRATRLGGDPGAAPVADAHGGADAQWQLPPSERGSGRGPGHLALSAVPLPGVVEC